MNWKAFLTIGTRLLLFFVVNSCDRGDIDYVGTTNFIYKNLTQEFVEIKLYDDSKGNFKNFSIPAGSEIRISLRQMGGKTGVGQPFGYTENSTDSIIIRFGDSDRCLVDFPKIFSVRDYDNFSESMYSTSNNTLIYNIDSEELDLAISCQ